MKTKLTLIFGLFLILEFSCTKDTSNQNNTPVNNYFYLTAAQLNQTPYFTNPTFDTISFASDKGDTLTFVKTKTDTTWYCEPTTNNPDNKDQNCYQTIHNTYSTINGTGSFDVIHSRKCYINFLNYLVPNVITISFNNSYFVFSESVIGDKTYKNYVGDFKVGNKTYLNTFFEYHNSNQLSKVKGYFSQLFGVVEVADSNINKSWSLNN
jgi:hypothetical protein